MRGNTLFGWMLLLGALLATPAHAETITIITTEEWVEIDADGDGVFETIEGDAPSDLAGVERFDAGIGATAARIAPAIATYGPFRVVDQGTVQMVGTVDSATPAAFARMMAAWPALKRLEMVECPGSEDEDANHRLARMVRRAAMETHVVDHGSIRSGAVDLFLAGVRRTAAPDAEFAVHSWQDSDGMEPDDFAADAPENRQYLDYYREMGLTPAQAREFYALTNSVPHDRALSLGVRDMARFGLIDGNLTVEL